MAYILHIDTSGNIGTTAISREGMLISSTENADTRNHAATINLHIEKVLTDAGITMQQLDAIAVCGGPGSYTGLRIGLATAKGLCYVLDKPLLMHSKMLLLTLGHYYTNKSEYDYYAAILSARDKEHYVALYNNKLEPVTEPRHIFEEELNEISSQINGKTLLVGDITDAVRNSFDNTDNQIIANNNIDLNGWCNYAQVQYNCKDFVNLAHAEPFYLKQVYTHKPKTNN